MASINSFLFQGRRQGSDALGDAANRIRGSALQVGVTDVPSPLWYANSVGRT